MRRRGGPPGDDLVEVELHDGPVPDPPLEPAPDQVPRARLPARSRPALALLAVLVAGGLVATAAELRTEGARREALAAVPGILTSLEDPWTVSWERPGADVGSIGSLVLVQDGATLHAVDVATGVVRWTRSLPLETFCRPVGEANVRFEADVRFEPDVVPGTSPTGPAGPDLLGCSTWESSGYSMGLRVLEMRVEVVDAATGTTLRTLRSAGTPALAEPVGATVVHAFGNDAGTLTLQRWDPATGVLLSESTSADPLLADEDAPERTIERFGDVLVVSRLPSGEPEMAFSVTTGAPVDLADLTPAQRGHGYAQHLPDGSTATWTSPSDGSPGAGAVLEPGGSVRFALPGAPVQPPTTDATLPELLVVSEDRPLVGGSLVGIDITTGERLWEAQLNSGWTLLLVDGRLLVRQDDKVVAVDARDGTVLWSRFITSSAFFDGLTDGASVLVLEASGDGPVVVAYRLEDGVEVWRSLRPAGAGSLELQAGFVVGQGEGSVFGLGP